MTSETENIFSRFYNRVEDYKIAGLEQQIVDEMLSGYLKTAISQPRVRRLFKKIFFDPDIGEVEYTMLDVWDNDTDQEYVEEVLAFGMVLAWMSPRYYSTLLTQQAFTNKEQSFYSQANHMAEIKNMYEKAKIDFNKYIRDRGYSLSLVNAE